jgi:uncharacterized protein YlxW (UPF0749 family)
MLNSKKVCSLVLLLLTVTVLFFSSNVAALNFSYQDNVLGFISIASTQDAVKPGSLLTTTITGMLPYTAPAGHVIVFHIAFSVDTASQQSKVLVEQDMVLDNKYTVKSLIAQLMIPSDALNGAYIYATVTNGTITFSKVPIALIQNPLYSELQSQLDSLKGLLSDQQFNNTLLQNQLVLLQIDYNASLTNSSLLRNQIATLLTEKELLQNQLTTLQQSCSNLQAELNSINADHAALMTQLGALQINNTELQNENLALLNQTADLQKQLSTLQSNSANLQTTITRLSNETDSLQLQLVNLQSTSNALQKKNTTTSVLMYISTVAFVVVTAYVLLGLIRRKGKSGNASVKKPKEKPLF